VSSLAIENIGLLVTNDPSLGDGSLGIVRDATLVFDGDRVAAVESGSAAADAGFDAAGRCVLPGFVDSHTHLVFAGDRAEEFAARLAGRPYEASGIRVTTEATRAAGYDQLRELTAGRRAEALRAGITHLEIKSGYGLDVGDEQRLCEIAAEFTDDVTFLGAHAIPPEYEGRADEYVELVCGEMLAACAPSSRWIDVFCERGAFDADQSRAVLAARGPASSWPWRWRPRPSITAPTSTTRTSAPWQRVTPWPPSSRPRISRLDSPIRTRAG
jgi:imidazolonepropionase